MDTTDSRKIFGSVRIPTEEFMVDPALAKEYEDVNALWPLYDRMEADGNLILTGPKGCGKSLSITGYAAQHQIPLITFSCSEDVRTSDLVGIYTLRGDSTIFALGPVTTAIDVANETGHAILALEEINSLSPQSQKVLNPLTDFHRSVFVHIAGRSFKLKKGAKLWITATMNPSAYGGVYVLNEDLKSRFDFLRLGYPTSIQELRILQAQVPELKKTKYPWVASLLRVAQETRQGECDYELSTRDLVQSARNILKLGKPMGLRILASKFEEGDEANYITTRIQSHFRVDVAT